MCVCVCVLLLGKLSKNKFISIMQNTVQLVWKWGFIVWKHRSKRFLLNEFFTFVFVNCCQRINPKERYWWTPLHLVCLPEALKPPTGFYPSAETQVCVCVFLCRWHTHTCVLWSWSAWGHQTLCSSDPIKVTLPFVAVKRLTLNPWLRSKATVFKISFQNVGF